MQKVKPDLKAQTNHGETSDQALVRTATSPECLSASVLTICHNVEHAQVTEMVAELRQQSAAIYANDLSRPESMLIAQAHTLDGLFADVLVPLASAKGRRLQTGH